MEAAAGQSWYVRKHADGSIFGPLPFEQLRRWADGAQIAPHDKLSQDQTTWQKAPMFPELGMDWLVEVTSEQYYGPTTLGALREFLRLGEIDEATVVINSCNGTRRQIRDLPAVMLPPHDAETEPAREDAPATSPIAVDLHDRIRELEQSLQEERRALAECEARCRELETRGRESAPPAL